MLVEFFSPRDIYDRLNFFSKEFNGQRVEIATNPCAVGPPLNFIRLSFELVNPHRYAAHFFLGLVVPADERPPSVARHLGHHLADLYRCTDREYGGGLIFANLENQREPEMAVLASRGEDQTTIGYSIGLGDYGASPLPLGLSAEDSFLASVQRFERVANLVLESSLMASSPRKLKEQKEFQDLLLTLNVL